MPSHIHFGVEAALPWALYVGMFAAFFASIMWRPSIGLYVLVFALPMQTGRYKLHDFFLGPQFVDLLLAGVILGLILRGKPAITKNSLSMFILSFALFLYLSLWEGSFIMGAPLPLWITDSRFSDWKNYVEMFVLALVTAATIREKTQVRILIVVMCLSVLVVNRNYYSVLAGRNLSQYSDDVRDAGMLGYAGVNGFAAFQAMFASLLLGLYVAAKNLLVKFGLLAMLATCVYCLLFSFSRGGYVGLLVGVITVGALQSKKYLVFALLLVIGWQVALPDSVQQRIAMTKDSGSASGQLDSSSEERIALWKDALSLFARNPLTGTGLGTYADMGRVGPYRDTHNYYVKVLVETGAVGLFLFLLLLKKLIGSGLSLARSTDDHFWSSIGRAFVAMAMSGIALNVFGDRWTYQQVDSYLWVMLGCVTAGLLRAGAGDATREVAQQMEFDDAELEVVAE